MYVSVGELKKEGIQVVLIVWKVELKRVEFIDVVLLIQGFRVFWILLSSEIIEGNEK